MQPWARRPHSERSQAVDQGSVKSCHPRVRCARQGPQHHHSTTTAPPQHHHSTTTTTTTTKLSVPSVPLFASPVEEWTLAGNPRLHAPLEPRSGEDCDDCELLFGTSSSRSQWPWRQHFTTQPTRRPGPSTTTEERRHRVLRTF